MLLYSTVMLAGTDSYGTGTGMTGHGTGTGMTGTGEHLWVKIASLTIPCILMSYLSAPVIPQRTSMHGMCALHTHLPAESATIPVVVITHVLRPSIVHPDVIPASVCMCATCKSWL